MTTGRSSPRGPEHRTDSFVWDELQYVMDTYHPSLTLVNLGSTDGVGHQGDWDRYLAAIAGADQVVQDIYDKIQADPVYKDKTALIVTSDHGRHLDGIYTGFKDHGCTCLGCRNVMFLAIGPGIRENAVIGQSYCLADIGPTIGYMLGFETIYSEGRIIRDMFVEPPPVKDSFTRTRPDMACNENNIYLACCLQRDGRSEIVFSRSADSGANWSDRVVVSEEHRPYNDNPSIAARGSKVGVAWTCYHTGDGSFRLAVRESNDYGDTWSDVIYFEGAEPYVPDTNADLSYQQGYLEVVWQETGFKVSSLRQARVRYGSVLSESVLDLDYYAGVPRSCSGVGGSHVVYTNLDDLTCEWEVYFTFHDSGINEWTEPVMVTDYTSNHCYDPDVAADNQGLHVVWGENDGGQFKVVARNTTDGIFWDNPVVLSSSSIGSWRPRIASNGTELVVVWEEYTQKNPSIYAACSTDGGITWSAPVAITTEDVTHHFLPAAILGDQNILHSTSMRRGDEANLDFSQMQF